MAFNRVSSTALTAPPEPSWWLSITASSWPTTTVVAFEISLRSLRLPLPRMESLETRSRDVQERTFCKWLNTKLESQGYQPMTSLVKDLSDGVRLIQLMEIMGDVSLGRYNKNPKMRIQKAENVNRALEFINSRGVKLTNIGPEDIIDGNLKLILGMIWTLVLRFTIADISEEGLSAKEGLLLWCQRKTAPYKEVDVQDFSTSWSDGLALCALIHCHRPDLLDYDKLDKANRHENARLAFQVAAEHLGIPQLFEVEDLCDSNRPDERSVMTYVASYFHAFSTMDQAQTVSRRVEKFAELMQSVWISRNDYERRVRVLLHALEGVQAGWATIRFEGTYADAMDHSVQFSTYKQTIKRNWVTEKQDLTTLFSNVQTKLRTYGLREYFPQPGLAPADLDSAWASLLDSEAKTSKAINAQIREIKDSLRKTFANLANSFERKLNAISTELANIGGPLEDQQEQIHILEGRVSELADALKDVAKAEATCSDANIDENDYTVFTCQDLRFEFELVVQNITKKIAFLDNQIVSRSMTNLTPAQLEQFESTFRYFDKDETNTLNLFEMSAALASLGIVYPDEDLDIIYDELLQGYGAVTFEAFINLLVDITEDQTTPEQLRDAFRVLSNDKPFVTELDLRLAQVPAHSVDYLKEAIPSKSNEVGEAEYDYETWLDQVFAYVPGTWENACWIQMETPSTPKSATPKKPVYVGSVETSGDTWTDVREATKRLSFSDFSRISEMPCVRSSLLTGIASGVGVGVIRGVSARPFVASNWAMSTFLVISTGSWMLCQKAKRDELMRIHRVMDSMPARTLKKDDWTGPQSG